MMSKSLKASKHGADFSMRVWRLYRLWNSGKIKGQGNTRYLKLLTTKYTDFTRTLHGLYTDFTRTLTDLHGLYTDGTRTLHGRDTDFTRTAGQWIGDAELALKGRDPARATPWVRITPSAKP